MINLFFHSLLSGSNFFLVRKNPKGNLPSPEHFFFFDFLSFEQVLDEFC